MAYGDVITQKYWNTNGIQIAIVATEGGANDVAAYIGATKGAKHEIETVQWAQRHGAKLNVDEALGMLPNLADILEEYNLHYRP